MKIFQKNGFTFYISGENLNNVENFLNEWKSFRLSTWPFKLNHIETPKLFEKYKLFFHRLDGPAVFKYKNMKTKFRKYKATYEEYWESGKLQNSQNGLVIHMNQYHHDSEFCEIYLKDGKLHRDENDLPAFINLCSFEGLREEWWQNGVRHRDNDLPAVKSYENIEYWINGKRHRDKGPAKISIFHDQVEYYQNDQLHRLDGPAVFYNQLRFWDEDEDEKETKEKELEEEKQLQKLVSLFPHIDLNCPVKELDYLKGRNFYINDEYITIENFIEYLKK